MKEFTTSHTEDEIHEEQGQHREKVVGSAERFSQDESSEKERIADWRGRLFASVMNGVVKTYTLGTMNREEAQAKVIESLSGQSDKARRRWKKVDSTPFLRVAKRAWEGTLGVDFGSAEPLETHQAMARYGSGLLMAAKDTISVLKPGLTVAQAVVGGIGRIAQRAKEKDPGSAQTEIAGAAETFMRKNILEIEEFFKKYIGEDSDDEENKRQYEAAA